MRYGKELVNGTSVYDYESLNCQFIRLDWDLLELKYMIC